jgi:hypothetical protein
MVRAIQFGELLRQVHTRLKKHPELMAEFAKQGHTLPPEQVARAKRAAARVPREELRRGRKGYSPDFYRWVAHQYLDLQAKNKGRGIREVIAEEGRKRLDRTEPVPLDTVKTWLRRARELEFIVFEKQGRVGASAGPKLYAEEEQ